MMWVSSTLSFIASFVGVVILFSPSWGHDQLHTLAVDKTIFSEGCLLS